MKKTEAVEKLIDYFDQNGWILGLNAQKIRKRSSLSNEQDRPGWVIVEIERHRATLGTHYTQGAPMSAMQTYWMRYAVHETMDNVKELPNINSEIAFNIEDIVNQELETGFDIDLEPINSEKYRIYNNISGAEGIVSNIQETKEFALNSIDIEMWSDNFEDNLHSEKISLSEDERKELIIKYKDTLKNQIIEFVKEEWERKPKW